jgi:hypothetical protein
MIEAIVSTSSAVIAIDVKSCGLPSALFRSMTAQTLAAIDEFQVSAVTPLLRAKSKQD